jgi:glycosyltransferase involved in cell wall biosynthesis
VARRVLMIAYHFPPLRGSSGIQRTLRFAQHLPSNGWDPIVVSAHPRAYPSTGEDQLRDIPASVPVYRAFALDTARHLAIGGRYPDWLARPDRWWTWWFGAVPAALRAIRRYRPDVIWSTYPIATAHRIGLTLHRLTGLPWVADFRDSMTEDHYPRDPVVRAAYRRIEGATIARCARAVFTTPGAVRMYRDRYPEIPAVRYQVIENGYDETTFSGVAKSVATGPEGATVLLHSGLVYPQERDPRMLFRALANLKARGAITPATLRVVLRAGGHDDFLGEAIRSAGVGDIVELRPAIGYREALAEMLGAQGLLILQGSGCNHQIPAKVYEYLRAGRPILGLTDPAGDTAGVLRSAGVDTLAPLDDPQAIEQMLVSFVERVRAGRAPVASTAAVAMHSREHKARELAGLLDTLV